MKGPIYIAHPYTGDREANVRLAAGLSSAVNLAGGATISPLQESYGREPALAEHAWLAHGLVLLQACRAVVLPRGWQLSAGCRAEVQAAKRREIPVYEAWLEGREWVLPMELKRWLAS